MDAVVAMYNARHGRFAVVQPGYGDYTVFLLIGDADLRVGQMVRGDVESSMCQSLENLETGQLFDVEWQVSGCTADHARRLVG